MRILQLHNRDESRGGVKEILAHESWLLTEPVSVAWNSNSLRYAEAGRTEQDWTKHY